MAELVLKVPSDVIAAVCAKAATACHPEVCGILLGTAAPGRLVVERLAYAQNAARSASEFAIGMCEVRRIDSLARRVDLDMLAVLHTHRSGDARLSVLDRVGLRSSDLPWVVVGVREDARRCCWDVRAYMPGLRAAISVEVE